ncbi:FtsX-like permease family protein [Metabacillus halosaccharovorans]|uniref:ABC transporter permease n=1 Tax=Metabacillus halosaccharovorans TaxID=930124 RepID=UPI00203E5361|nr:ABC transporter permease [Metabacillus halosaccharovorans]MCM3443229.1 ABC transporter permease [Metabacillus halosaccharovorans]
MSKFFYVKLAITNIRKNGKTYYPYILTCMGTVSMYYIMHFLSLNEGLDNMAGGNSLKTILNLGTYVVAIFSVIFLFYTNSFLVKRRKKEFGLFNILGMEKKHIAKVMAWEALFVAFTSLIIGLFTGILMSKLMFLLLLKILHFKVSFGFVISWNSILGTVALFIGIFILTLLNNLRQIHLANPIELIKGGEVGEREPKTKWLLTFGGIILLAIGYYIALTTESPLNALNLFFTAVVLVILGTYALFIAGTITLLKILRKNKTFYYKTRHFISVSGMIYRMKQNAAGLASICVLSTFVLVMLSSTVSLYVGMEDLLRTRYPQDITVSANNLSVEASDELHSLVMTEAEKQVTMTNPIHYRYLSLIAIQNDHTFSAGHEGKSFNKFSVLNIIPLSEYNRLENQSMTLKQNEVLLSTFHGEVEGDSIKIAGNTFDIKERIDEFSVEGMSEDSQLQVNSYGIVVSDESIVQTLNHSINGPDSDTTNLSYYIGFDAAGKIENEIALATNIQKILQEHSIDGYSEGREHSKESFYSLYGGLFFLGIFLGGLFIMATVLIIYYKQISEGYDDKHRFKIMRKVGLSNSEIKSAIQSQVLIVFFLPLVMAVIHIAFAFKIISKLLALFNLTNVSLFAFTTAGTIVVFAILYAIVYGLTARVYYRVVSS